MKLTANQIRYLLTIRKLAETRHVIKSVDVAKQLDISRASVHKMLGCLKDMNCITQEPYSSIRLSRSGQRVANECLEKYELIREQLKPVIDVKEDFDLGICTLLERCRQ